jgi:hypothetical protein
MVPGRAVSAAVEDGVEAASAAGANERRGEKTTGTGGWSASNEGALRTGSADHLGRERHRRRPRLFRGTGHSHGPLSASGMNTCAPATLAVVASSQKARKLNFIGVTFGSRRLNGRIRQQQRRRRRVVAELVKSDGEAPIADVFDGCWETAEYWQQRAAGALRHAKYKERPAVSDTQCIGR